MFRKSTVWICCAAVLLLTGLLTGAGAEVAITKETFPDDNFHSYIRAHIDQNHDEVLQLTPHLIAAPNPDVHLKLLKNK